MNEELSQLENSIIMEELASGNITVDQVLNMELSGESSPLSEEETQLLEQAVEEAHNEIPKNSGSLLVDESTSRFSSAIWYQEIQKKVIILAGVGGIGRFGNLIKFLIYLHPNNNKTIWVCIKMQRL